MTFTPIETFQCEETGNWYCKGLLVCIPGKQVNPEIGSEYKVRG